MVSVGRVYGRRESTTHPVASVGPSQRKKGLLVFGDAIDQVPFIVPPAENSVNRLARFPLAPHLRGSVTGVAERGQ
jgi:hypothetical protein